jgi:cob(I)alamin adenosyltransferase
MKIERKIYTKTGDKGMTSLLGGTRVKKYHEQVEAYGTVDELNSFIGLIKDQEIATHYKDILSEIQDRLFTIESILASENKEITKKLPCLKQSDISLLENEIDKLNESLPELTAFILPGGHQIVSFCHIARCVCRRTERLVILLAEKIEIDEQIIQYFNRLSDYLFVLARKITLDLGLKENLWKARKCDE